MYPFIVIGKSSIPTFSLCVLIGALALIFSIFIKLWKRGEDREHEILFIIPKLFIALGFGYLGSIFFDALFKIPQNGGFALAGMQFYGGAIAGMAAYAISIKIFEKRSSMTMSQWLDFSVVPFLAFHSIARVGCFFGGCCYGMESDGPFALLFPDMPSAGIYHNGHKVLPTQLFEAGFLALLAVALHFVKNRRFVIYCITYAIFRFSLEFLRADNRGDLVLGLSPSQLIAVLVLCVVAVALTIELIVKREKEKRLLMRSSA